VNKRVDSSDVIRAIDHHLLIGNAQAGKPYFLRAEGFKRVKAVGSLGRGCGLRCLISRGCGGSGAGGT
jgi:hypothetical protein